MATGTAFSNKLEEEILVRYLKNNTTFLAQPTTVYVGIGTGGDDTGLTGEPASTRGYTRSSISFGATAAGTNPTTAMQVTGPTAAITLGPNSVSDWGTITHFGIYDAQTSGNLLFWGALASSVSIAVNDSFQFTAGAITIGVD